MSVVNRRVLFLATHLSCRDARFLKLRDSMTRRGWRVGAAAPAFPTEMPPDDVQVVAGGRVDTLLAQAQAFPLCAKPASYLRALRRRRALVAEAVKFEPDLIITFDPETLPSAVEAKRRTRACLVYDAHEYHVDQLPGPEVEARTRWVKRAQARWFDDLDGFVTVSEALAKRYAASTNLPEYRFILRNLTDWTPEATGSDKLRALAHFDPHHLILVYHGAFQAGRGLPILSRLSHILPEPWRIVCIGSGPFEEKLKASCNSSKLKVLAPVPYADLPVVLGSADMGAIIYEGLSFNLRHALPNKLWEYASLGIPILCTDLPEIGAIVREHEIGFRVSQQPAAEEVADLLAGLTSEALLSASHRATYLAQHNRWADETNSFFHWVETLMNASSSPS